MDVAEAVRALTETPGAGDRPLHRTRRAPGRDARRCRTAGCRAARRTSVVRTTAARLEAAEHRATRNPALSGRSGSGGGPPVPRSTAPFPSQSRWPGSPPPRIPTDRCLNPAPRRNSYGCLYGMRRHPHRFITRLLENLRKATPVRGPIHAGGRRSPDRRSLPRVQRWGAGLSSPEDPDPPDRCMSFTPAPELRPPVEFVRLSLWDETATPRVHYATSEKSSCRRAPAGRGLPVGLAGSRISVQNPQGRVA